jgi:hypothetical protein
MADTTSVSPKEQTKAFVNFIQPFVTIHIQYLIKKLPLHSQKDSKSVLENSLVRKDLTLKFSKQKGKLLL